MAGYLGQPQQSQPYRADNTFQGGVQMDSPPDNTPATVLTRAFNGHLLRQQGSEILWQTEPGMRRAFAIPPNHWVHGWAERNGLLYLLLCELNPTTGAATGGGQLGTWPSPSYAYQVAPGNPNELVETGALTPDYRPLHVYYGDHNGLRPGPFQSAGVGAAGGYLNLALDAPSELELQDSYDGTLNIVVNDRGRNPALLINSGFAVEPPLAGAGDDWGRYRVIIREGAAQTNRYRSADFTSRLRLHPKGGSLAKAYLVEVADGGQLPGGEYRYYFTYADADDNETGVFAECGPVPVFDAATPAEAEGALPGQKTTRRVVLRLAQLDATFGFVRVRYVRRAGEPSALAQGYLLPQRLPISPAGAVEFSHGGYEEEEGLNADQLQAVAGSVSAFTTMCQAGNRLLLAGIKQAAVDDAPLLAFATALQLSHQQVSLPGVPGVDAGGEASSTGGDVAGIYNPLNQTQFTGEGAGLTPDTDPRAVYLGGHFNPLNAALRRGYPTGESVAFGVRFILDDYSLSDTYPLTGADNLGGALDYAQMNAVANPAVFADDGWSQAFGFGAYNKVGVYRFPEGNAAGMRPLLEQGTNAVNVLAARVKLPAIPEAVRRRAVGVQFMRATRIPNRLAQGYLLPTVKSLVTPPNNDVFDQHHNDMRSTLAGTATGNLKVLPTLRGLLEGVDRNYGKTVDGERGVMPFVFNRRTTVGGIGYDLHDPKRLAFYSPDAILRPTTYLPRLNQQDVQLRATGLAFTKSAVRFANSENRGGSFSLQKTTYHQALPTVTGAGRSFWTLDKQFVVNDGRFGSAEKFLLGKSNAATEKKYLINLAWGPYVGVRFNTALSITALLGAGTTVNTGFGAELVNLTADAPAAVGFVANLYGNGGLLTLPALRQLYRPEALTYVPVTQRLGWNELQSQLDAEGHLLLYGGDTYVAPVYCRMTRTLTPGERKETKFDAAVGQVLSLVCETGANPYARGEQPSGTGSGAEGGADYLPHLGAGEQKFDLYRQAPFSQQADATRYNGGYASEERGSTALVTGVARVSGVPFRARHFPTRVWATSPSVSGSFANGYRFLPPLGFRDYENSLGPLTRLVPGGNQAVLLVHRQGLEVIAVNERVLTGAGAGGPVFAQGLDFLPPTATIISRRLGCQHPLAVCATPAGVYGLDAQQGCAWFWPYGAGEATPLSDFAVSKMLGPALAGFKAGTVLLGGHDARVVYDSTRGDVVFSLYRRVGGGGPMLTLLTLIYSEPLKQWMGEAGYAAQALVDVPRRGLYSLPLGGQSQSVLGAYSLWQHRALPAAGPTAQRAGAYGKAQDAFVEFNILGTGVDTTKLLDNLVLVSEGRDPDRLDVATAEQPGGFSQLLIGPPADITKRTAQRREGHTWVTVKKAEKRRGRWIRVRLSWLAAPTEPNATPKTLPQDAGRLVKVSSVLRDSFT